MMCMAFEARSVSPPPKQVSLLDALLVKPERQNPAACFSEVESKQ